ncbi:MAG: hypothetical protein KIS66_07865 [Fimbriimonadaceae bacterium]|nr:hypothetical protein [Fimbriimonadaceae bacterium]
MKRAPIYLIALSVFALVAWRAGLNGPPLGDAATVGSVPSVARVTEASFEREFADRSAAGEWKDSFEWYMRAKQYPNFGLDADAYNRAAAQRDALEPARERGGVRGRYAPLGKWQLVGPKNLDVPYKRWWGPKPVSGRVNALAYDPSNDNNLYLGAASGGLFISQSDGSAWNPMSDRWLTLQTSSIAVDPTNFARIFVGTGDYPGGGIQGAGIMKSTNFGLSWDQVTPEQASEAISGIVIDPEDPDIVIATSGRGSAGTGQVYRTTNNGFDWAVPTLSGGGTVPTGNYCDLDVSLVRPSDGSRNYFALRTSGRLYRSRNRGATWTQTAFPSISGGVSMYQLACSPTAPDRIYLLVSRAQSFDSQGNVTGGNPGMIWRSNDAGGSWTNITGDFVNTWWSQSGYNYPIAAVLNGPGGSEVVVLGQTGLYMCANPTANSGWTWTDLGQTTVAGPSPNRLKNSPALTHNDQHALTRHPSRANEFLLGNDGGAYRVTLNGGVPTVENFNANLSLAMFYHASFHPTAANGILGGTQDNASPNTATTTSLGDLNNWDNSGGGDGGWTAIDQTDPLVQYASAQNGWIFRSTDGWDTYDPDNWNPTRIDDERGSGSFGFIVPMEMDLNTSRFVYQASSNAIYRWDNQTATWTNSFATMPGGVGSITCMHVPVGQASRMYVGTTNGRIVAVNLTNGATQALPIVGLPNRSVTDISVHASNLNRILVTFSGTNAVHVHEGEITGAGVGSLAVTWANRRGSDPNALPDIPVNTIERDPYDPQNTWYVGTDVGVLMTSSRGLAWKNATEPLKLPNVEVRHLQYVPGTGYLNCATWGRGMYRIKLGESRLKQLTLGVPGGPHPGGDGILGVVEITHPAPVGGYDLDLFCSDPLVSLPETVRIPEGETAVQFNGTTRPVSQATEVLAEVRAGGETLQTTVVLAPPAYSLWVSPSSVEGGAVTVGHVALPSAAPAGGTLISLSSSTVTVLSVPASVTVPAGQKSASFAVTTTPVGTDQVVTVSGTLSGQVRSADVTVRRLAIESLVLAVERATGGGKVSGTVRLNAAANADTPVALSSDNPAASVGPSVVVPAGSSTATFEVETSAVMDEVAVTITGELNGRATDTLRVSPLLVRGSVAYQDVVAGLDLVQTIRLEFKEPGTGTNFAVADVDLGPAMEFTVASPRLAPYDVTLKVTHWLRRRVSIDPSTGAGSLVFSLINGDVNGDNSVNISDFLFLRAAFGSNSTSPNWNPMADLNMDGSVGIADFLVLRRNMGQSGD